MFIPTNQRTWKSLSTYVVASTSVRHVIVLAVLGVTFLSAVFGPRLVHSFAQTPCPAGDQTYTAVTGDTLGTIADQNNTTWQNLADYNKLADANYIQVDQQICIPDPQTQGIALSPPVQDTEQATTAPLAYEAAGIKGGENPFPYGQCTWWASQRYAQMHGGSFFVPWNGNAWQWTDGAYASHWHVSSHPTVGAIVNLQPWVQGAYDLGHVAVVEKILSNGRVVASNMNWAGSGSHVVYSNLAPGRGVTFLTA